MKKNKSKFLSVLLAVVLILSLGLYGCKPTGSGDGGGGKPDPDPVPDPNAGKIVDTMDASTGWQLTGQGNLSFSGGKLVLADLPGDDPWAIARKEYKGVNVSKYKYLKMDVDSFSQEKPTELNIKMAKATTPEKQVLVGKYFYEGAYYLDLSKSYTYEGTEEAVSFNSASEDIYLIVGSVKDQSSVKINGFESAETLPAETNAPDYAETFETIGGWRDNTGKIRVKTAGEDSYAEIFPKMDGLAEGEVINRLRINTTTQKYLTFDVRTITDATADVKARIISGTSISDEIMLGVITTAGEISFDAATKLGAKTNCEILLFVKVKGASAETALELNGLYGSATAVVQEFDPLREEFENTNGWNSSDSSVMIAAAESKATFTKKVNAPYGGMLKTFNLNTTTEHKIAFKVTDKGAGLTSFAFKTNLVGEDGNPKTGDNDINLTLYEGSKTGTYCVDLPEAYRNKSALTLTIGVFVVGDKASQSFVTLDFIKTSETDISEAAPAAPINEEFEGSTLSENFSLDKLSAAVTEGKAKLTVSADSGYGIMKGEFTVNTTVDKYLVIGLSEISASSGGMNLKVGVKGGAETTVFEGKKILGEYWTDLSAVSSGERVDIVLQIAALGASEFIKIDYVKTVTTQPQGPQVPEPSIPTADINEVFDSAEGWTTGDNTPMSAAGGLGKVTKRTGSGDDFGYGGATKDFMIDSRTKQYLSFELKGFEAMLSTVTVKVNGTSIGDINIGFGGMGTYVKKLPDAVIGQEKVAVTIAIYVLGPWDSASAVYIDNLMQVEASAESATPEASGEYLSWTYGDPKVNVKVLNGQMTLLNPASGYGSILKTVTVDLTTKTLLRFDIASGCIQVKVAIKKDGVFTDQNAVDITTSSCEIDLASVLTDGSYGDLSALEVRVSVYMVAGTNTADAVFNGFSFQTPPVVV